MATVPGAKTSVSATAGAGAAGVDLICVIAPVAQSADGVPRLLGNDSAVYGQYGYSEGLEYSSLHFNRTGKPVLFCGIPIATAGAIGRINKTGNTGSSVATVTAGGAGCLTEHSGVVTVLTGGTVGTDQILLQYSLDGGRNTKKLRIGTGTSYTFPYINVTLSLGAGTLVAGDTIITWFGSGPRGDASGLATTFTALAGQQKLCRSILLCGDLQSSSEAQAFLDKLNDYESSKDRYVYGRASVYDRLPLANMSQSQAKMTGNPSLTFAAAGHTITRSSGSWITDGFVTGDTVRVSGSVSNNGAYVSVTVTSATVLTFASGMVNEGPSANITVTSEPTLTFAEVGGTGDTLTRSRGSWFDDGFRVGDKPTISGTASNNFTAAQGITALTATVMTFGTDDMTPEVIGMVGVGVASGQTKAAWMTQIDAAFSSIDGDTAKRIDLAAGRGRVLSPFSSTAQRRSPAWAASLREYQHDLHIPTWRKKDGNTGFDLFDSTGTLVEWDDRPGADGGAGSAARFTTFRTWGNGPGGAFICRSLTRAGDGNLLANTHNMAVVDLAMTVNQAMTENFIGRTPQLNDNGTATTDELKTLESEVNQELEVQLLTSHGEGKRASKAVWTANTDDVLNIDDATLNGTLDLNLNGTIVSVKTTVRVRSGG